MNLLEIKEYMRALLEALQHLHLHKVERNLIFNAHRGLQIIHRDIKPSNFLRDSQRDSQGSGRFRLVDFGLARVRLTSFAACLTLHAVAP